MTFKHWEFYEHFQRQVWVKLYSIYKKKDLNTVKSMKCPRTDLDKT